MTTRYDVSTAEGTFAFATETLPAGSEAWERLAHFLDLNDEDHGMIVAAVLTQMTRDLAAMWGVIDGNPAEMTEGESMAYAAYVAQATATDEEDDNE